MVEGTDDVFRGRRTAARIARRGAGAGRAACAGCACGGLSRVCRLRCGAPGPGCAACCCPEPTGDPGVSGSRDPRTSTARTSRDPGREPARHHSSGWLRRSNAGLCVTAPDRPADHHRGGSRGDVRDLRVPGRRALVGPIARPAVLVRTLAARSWGFTASKPPPPEGTGPSLIRTTLTCAGGLYLKPSAVRRSV